MNMSKISLALPLVLISAAAAGCGVDEAPNDPGSSDTSVTTDELGSAVTEQPLAAHGGGGGSFNGHVTPAAVIYGLQVNSGQFVDHITFFYYQPTRPDNQYAGEPLFSIGFGGGGGSANPSFVCPANQSIIGIRGASGSLVDRIGVVCGDVTNPDPFSSADGQSPVWGGGGGNFFDDRCGVGRLVDSFNVRSGSLLDNLQAICVNAQ
jgi:hypothetical protein